MKLALNGNAPTVEAGLYPAVCYGLIDIGTQENEYQGKVMYQRKAILKFELLDEFDNDDKRIVLTQIYNMSLNEKSKFRQHLRNWRGKDFTEEELNCFEPKNVMGSNVILNVIVNDRGRAVIDGTAKYKSEAVASGRDVEYFSFDDMQKGDVIPDFISEGILNLLQKSKEWDTISHETKHNEVEDDVPF